MTHDVYKTFCLRFLKEEKLFNQFMQQLRKEGIDFDNYIYELTCSRHQDHFMVCAFDWTEADRENEIWCNKWRRAHNAFMKRYNGTLTYYALTPQNKQTIL